MEEGVARATDVHHRRDFELDLPFVQGLSPLVGERRLLSVSTVGVGVVVAADEAERL